MPITQAQTTAAKDIIHAILAATAPKGKRQLAGMFLELVDRKDWPEYYSVSVKRGVMWEDAWALMFAG